MPRYELLVDGKARDRAGSDEELRAWLAGYREQHVEDDPDAVHVQIRRLSSWSWLTGGKLVPREPFLQGEPRTVAAKYGLPYPDAATQQLVFVARVGSSPDRPTA